MERVVSSSFDTRVLHAAREYACMRACSLRAEAKWRWQEAAFVLEDDAKVSAALNMEVLQRPSWTMEVQRC